MEERFREAERIFVEKTTGSNLETVEEERRKRESERERSEQERRELQNEVKRLRDEHQYTIAFENIKVAACARTRASGCRPTTDANTDECPRGFPNPGQRARG